jgi:hypothetical protein
LLRIFNLKSKQLDFVGRPNFLVCDIDPRNLTITPDRIILDEEDLPIGKECCNPNTIDIECYWDGNYCIYGKYNNQLTSTNIFNGCVIVSNSDKNITNKKCCDAKGGSLSKDSFGNIICVKN